MSDYTGRMPRKLALILSLFKTLIFCSSSIFFSMDFHCFKYCMKILLIFITVGFGVPIDRAPEEATSLFSRSPSLLCLR